MQSTSPLRSFFAALAAPHGLGPKTLPVELRSIARRLLRNSDGMEAEDVVGDFLVRLVEATRRCTSGSAAFLVNLEEPQLRAVVRHRMGQIVAERAPQRQLVKQLRDAVRRAIAQGLPSRPAAAPCSLMLNDKLSTALVAEAAAWFVDQANGPNAEDVAATAARLRDAYFGAAPGRVPSSVELQSVADVVDVKQLASRLRSELAPDILHTVRARLNDDSLAAIAKRAGIAVSSAHARVAKAAAEVKAIVEDARADRETGEAALALLAA